MPVQPLTQPARSTGGEHGPRAGVRVEIGGQTS